jgi:hypothetical protein
MPLKGHKTCKLEPRMLTLTLSPLIPTGLLLYGWLAQKQVHWIWSDIGAALFGMGIISTFLMGAIYLTETYSKSVGPASLSLSVFRPVAGFGFPLFAPSLYSGLELWLDKHIPITRFHCHWRASSNNAMGV